MKNLRTKNLIIFVLFISLPFSTFAESASSRKPKSTEINKIQDTQKAFEYFETELNFKTNAYFINRAIKEKMPNINIIDVRSAEAFRKGHIPGAINIPSEKYSGFEGNETDIPGLRKDAFNCIYCYSATCNLSQKAAKKFASLGYPVKEIAGGYKAWIEEYKFPVETYPTK